MATVTVMGAVVKKKFFPGSGDKKTQYLISVQDTDSGQRFGMFVPEAHPVVKVVEGEIVKLVGALSVNRSGSYFNLNLVDPILEGRFKLTEVK